MRCVSDTYVVNDPGKRESLSFYEGSLESPWDEIAIQYVLVSTNAAKKRPGEAFKEQSQLVL